MLQWRTKTSPIPSLLLAAIFLASFSLSRVASNLVGESAIIESLLKFKSNVAADPFRVFRGWTTATSICDWAGLECDENGFIVSLNLTSLGISGTLGDEIATITTLETIVLSGNDFGGYIPANFGSLRQLRHLDLRSNQLSGLIPESLTSLANLTYLDLAENILFGPIPESIGQLSKLEFLDLSENLLTGEIPPGITTITPLWLLDLSVNNLAGSIPSEIGNLWNLKKLSVHSNRLTGPLPESIRNLSQVQVFYVHNNQLSGDLSQVDWSPLTALVLYNAGYNTFSGKLPASLAQPVLFELLLPANNLTGPIPESFGNISSLQFLSLSLNNLNTHLAPQLSLLSNLRGLYIAQAGLFGSIPKEFGQLEYLELVDMSNNSLSGEIPEELVDATLNGCALYLQNNNLSGPLSPKYLNGDAAAGKTPAGQLWLFNNQLSGALPRKILASQGLVEVRLQNNHFSGPLPAGFSNSGSLKYLILAGNKFNGSIPASLFGPSLIQLDLSLNDLTGGLPSLPASLEALTLVNVSGNSLTGPLPSDWLALNSLVTIDASNNSLTGPIRLPAVASSNLTAVYLSSNRINGSLPAGIQDLANLRVLDLAGNQLSGDLPGDIGQVYRLSKLILSGNHLTGGIPAELGNLTFLSALYLDGNNFSGDIPPELGTPPTSNPLLEALDLCRNSLQGSIPAELANLTALVLFDLSENQLNGSIPDSLSGLTHLSRFNVSDNLLSGAIPAGSLSSLSADSFANNSGLCGAPLTACPSPPFQLSAAATAGIVVGAVAMAALLLLLCVVISLWVRRLGPDNGKLVFYTRLDCPVTYRQLVASTGNWSESQLLGTGGFGEVYKALLPDRKTVVAIKRLNRSSSQGISELRTEINTLGQLRHKNLVTLIASYVSEKESLLIYEYLPGGDLESYLFGNKKVFNDWSVRHKVLLGAAKGMKYLHHESNPNVIHRDIKPANILLDVDMEAHVADFGLAREIDLDLVTYLSTSVSGTVGYLASEYAQTGRLTTKSDVFSFGVVILQVLTGKRPTDRSVGEGGLAGMVSRFWVKKAALDVIDPKLIVREKEVGMLLGSLKLGLMCTSMNPHDRPSFNDVVYLLENLDIFNTKLVPPVKSVRSSSEDGEDDRIIGVDIDFKSLNSVSDFDAMSSKRSSGDIGRD